MNDGRQCRCCLVVKPLTEYYLYDGKYKTSCKQCVREKRKTHPNYIQPKKPEKKTLGKRWSTKREYNRTFMRRYKSMCGCFICGLKVDYLLDFHHKNPDEKEMKPSSMCDLSVDVIKNEIRKCVVLCANHHRMVHAGVIEV